MDYDVVIVGGGPAGLSAAVWLGRCRRRVLVCDLERPRNRVSRGVHGFLTRDGIAPAELRRLGRAEAEGYGVAFRHVEVTDARPLPSGYELDLADGEKVTCRKLLLATGLADNVPDIEGFAAFYGASVFTCTYFDGWEARDQRIAVLARGRKGVAMALSIQRWSADVRLFTHGSSRLDADHRALLGRFGIPVHTRRIARLEGSGDQLERVVLAGGEAIARDAMFFGTGRYQRSDLPARLGCRFDSNGAVLVSRHQETDRPNLYVAGDAARDVNFAIVAAAEGARAAHAMNTALTCEDQDRPSL